jgi:Uma2 family endonuclease
MLETITGLNDLTTNPVIEIEENKENMPSLNHSYLCLQLIKQLIMNDDIIPLPELTLDIANGLTPDISVFSKNKIQPNLFNDISRFPEKPILAIEVISSSQTVQEMLQKAKKLISEGVKTVWTVEPYSQTVFVTTMEMERIKEIRFHGGIIESEGIRVDFSEVFPKGASN